MIESDQLMDESRWSSFLDRYKSGEWRAVIFRDMVLQDIRRLGTDRRPTVLDIGCGRGFDDDRKLQASLVVEAGRYIGVEPDPGAEVAAEVGELHRCLFEDAQIPAGAVDVAFAVMVLEHLRAPQQFWANLHAALREGGVFWGFTIDARNWFAKVSMLTEFLGIKDWYLNRLQGERGAERYENYKVHYRCNTPGRIAQYAEAFHSMTVINFHHRGQLDYYLPRGLRWLGRSMDRLIEARKWPGSILAVRIEK